MDDLAKILPRLAIKKLRPAQEKLIKAAIAGKDILGILPTGAGKSACFQIPALLSNQLSLVVSPLIALMRDQIAKLENAGFDVAMLFSAQSEEEQEKIWQSLAQNQIRLLYLSPEQLAKSATRFFLDKLSIERAIIDEAHCYSVWGHDFRPDYREISSFLNAHPNISLSAFSATASPAVIHDLEQHLFMKHRPLKHITSPKRENISLRFLQKEKPRQQLLDEIKDEPSIIYAATRNKTEVLAKALCGEGLKAEYYHAGLESGQRARIESGFISGDIPIIVATNAFGMGVDKADIRAVIHADLPGSIEAYVQEIGRAARDGKPARAICLWSEEDIAHRREQIDTSSSDGALRAHKHYQLDVLVDIARNKAGWKEIEAYFDLNNETALPASHHISPGEDALTKLKNWRYALAQTKKIPPFMILPDALLERIAEADPKDFDALAALQGIGANRLENYGKGILSALGHDAQSVSHSRRKIALSGDGERFDALKKITRNLRLGESGRDKPLELSDRILARIVKAKPDRLDKLAEINGMNPERIARFGKAFMLELTRKDG